MFIKKTYYQFKPLLPRRLQIFLRRKVVEWERLSCTDIWPIDKNAGRPPQGWSGWPDEKRFALVLTHDVETARGQQKCLELSEIEMRMGFVSSFNFVPERYELSDEIHHHLSSNGFEIGVHGLLHDGKLYKSKRVFQKRTARINHYLKDWGAVGFRSPGMHHNLDWIHDLNLEYDASTFDTDPFEPQPNGMGTIFPFWVKGNSAQRGYVELPYTLPQDFTLYVIMREKDNSIWKHKLDWIARKGGMALLNAHPDYMNFDGKRLGLEQYPVQYYEDFLAYVKRKYEGQYWHVLPREIARFWTSSYSCQLPPQ